MVPKNSVAHSTTPRSMTSPKLQRSSQARTIRYSHRRTQAVVDKLLKRRTQNEKTRGRRLSNELCFRLCCAAFESEKLLSSACSERRETKINRCCCLPN